MKFNVRQAGQGDVDTLVRHRLEMWLEILPELKNAIEESEPMTRKWITEKLSEGEMVGFLVTADDGRIAGSGCVWVRDEQPRPTNRRLVVPYLLSMYSEKSFRRRGVARLVVQSAIDWCRQKGYDRIILHASDFGRPLYEEFGFKQTNEMRLKL